MAVHVGLIVLWVVAPFFVSYLIKLIGPYLPFLKRTDFQSYGKWAVVTGASDGIGRFMAIELAKKGMSLCLVGRNEEKLRETINMIPKPVLDTTETKLISDVDFENPNWAALNESLKGLDVGILVNNVGQSYPGMMYFHEVPETLIDQIINVNVVSAMKLTRIILPGMVNRRRGLIVCLGSAASDVPSAPLLTGYSAAKAAVKTFCRDLQVECRDSNVKVQCHIPWFVSTKMSKMRPSFATPSPQQYARCAIANMDTNVEYPMISPYIVHDLIFKAIGLIPVVIWNAICMPTHKSIRNQYLKKLEQKSKTQ